MVAGSAMLIVGRVAHSLASSFRFMTLCATGKEVFANVSRNMLDYSGKSFQSLNDAFNLVLPALSSREPRNHIIKPSRALQALVSQKTCG